MSEPVELEQQPVLRCNLGLQIDPDQALAIAESVSRAVAQGLTPDRAAAIARLWYADEDGGLV